MPLPTDEIRPGIVAILDASVLVSDKNIVYSEPDVPFRNGPFVCLEVKDDQSLWLQLTKAPDKRGLRLKITSEWKIDGSKLWQEGDTYIHDARRTFTGPLESFSQAGSKELPHQPHLRPKISPEGVDAALSEIRKFGVNTL
ncbi:hypothetical protein [Stutzerimonas nitrititolerans]|uniref:hypothetical protein n=1 Tax=Stutzerimonas nitrititolerans TaxID=2482751 RepID=UPI0028A0A8CE|nr:hypothetical protein [Stutzerimonas nitrititolerans]